jgi:hypothetical protein
VCASACACLHSLTVYKQTFDSVTIDVLLSAEQIDNYEFAFVRETHEYDLRQEMPDFVSHRVIVGCVTPPYSPRRQRLVVDTVGCRRH